MKKNEDKNNFKVLKILGFAIMMLGVVFLMTGTILYKHSDIHSINIMMGFGLVTIIVGIGVQIWVIKKKN
jgi:uncharacterized membrane protein